MGVVVGRRVGKAVTRNRLKRIIRELTRASYSEMALGHHCIVYPKVKILGSKFQEVEMAWNQMLRQLGILGSMRPK
jgi:ribonuclease P protein component